MAKGYASVDDLAAYMGMSFTAAQELIADLSIGTAEGWIDRATRHAWLEDSPITETIYPSGVSYSRVAKPPVESFDSVSVVWGAGGTAVVLDGTCGQYTVRSLRDGILLLPFGIQHAYAINVVYTPTGEPPPDEVTLATLVLAASNLRLSPTFTDDVDPTVVQRYVVGGELEVEFRKNLSAGGNVATAQALFYLDAWVKGYAVI